MDDILIASQTREGNKETTLALFKHLCIQGNKASRAKLQWASQKVIFLGHEVTGQGKTITEDRKKAILNTPKPKTKKQMMQFLGLCNYCRTWVANYAEITQSLLTMMYEEDLPLGADLAGPPGEKRPLYNSSKNS